MTTHQPDTPADQALRRTPLHGLHLALGAKMVPFAGYEMPLHYAPGILKEHLHTRSGAGLFDVSHMGQAELSGGPGLAAALERLVPGDIQALKPGRLRYTQLLNEQGGIRDDLMVTRLTGEGNGEQLLVVVNAACKAADFRLLAERLHGAAELRILERQALLALQGPKAADVLGRHVAGVGALAFMTAGPFTWQGRPLWISRSGYTGEDGFEIAVEGGHAEALARALLAEPEAEPVGLGARDSLRLEAGLCLYGHDIDETTSPVEADLLWSIGRRRREEGGFPGAARIQREIREGAPRRRVGLKVDGRTPAREGCEILDADGRAIGRVTSGGFGPSVGGPVAMGYVPTGHAAPGTAVQIVIRKAAHAARVAPMPFVPRGYKRP